MDLLEHNRAAWDGYVEKGDQWTVPVSAEVIDAARNGEWNVVLTPKKAVPHEWFPDLGGAKLLGLGCGGGQQGPIFAALGADVTIFDNSEKQLGQDRRVSDEFGLGITTVQGDMRDLSVFDDDSFDVIFNPCSILFVDDIRKVWKECFRVLRPTGILMTGLMNPLCYQLDEDTLTLIYKQPFSDLHSLPAEKLAELKQNNEALTFGHSFADQIGGQLDAGFMLTAIFEDDWGGESKFDEYFPSFMATRAVRKW